VQNKSPILVNRLNRSAITALRALRLLSQSDSMCSHDPDFSGRIDRGEQDLNLRGKLPIDRLKDWMASV
jgi:hypothetical protein